MLQSDTHILNGTCSSFKKRGAVWFNSDSATECRVICTCTGTDGALVQSGKLAELDGNAYSVFETVIISGDTNTSLGTSNTKIPSQKAVKTYIDNAISAAKNVVFPVGMTYIQFPGEKTPGELGWPGTWANRSSDLAGDFIRFEGGSANSFNNSRQSHQIQGHLHDFYATGANANSTPAYLSHGSSQNGIYIDRK